MIREALQYLVGLAPANKVTLDGITYTDKPLHKQNPPSPNTLVAHTLDAAVTYLQHNKDKLAIPRMAIHVVSPECVRILGPLDNTYMQRHVYMEVLADLPRHSFGQYMDVEEFLPYLKACFEDSRDRDTILQIVGNLVEENSITTKDDGITQQVTAKTGVARVENVNCPNPVTLAPFCTFPEVECQPMREFVFRMRKGPTCALIPADGNSWKVRAIESVAACLEQRLDEMLPEGHGVSIIA